MKKFILGIAGASSSGKSEVLKILKSLGWVTIDCDKVTHDIYREGAIGQRRICDFFGEEFLRKNGEVNRAKLRRVVFSDPKKLVILNNLIHPLVMEEVRKIIEHEIGDKIAIEAIEFDEKYFKGLVSKVLLIERPEDLRVKKTDKELSWRKPFKVDAKIVNDSTLKALEKKVIMALDKLKKIKNGRTRSSCGS